MIAERPGRTRPLRQGRRGALEEDRQGKQHQVGLTPSAPTLKETTMNFTLIDLKVESTIATITLNRPDKRNAMSDDMRSEFIDALETRRRRQGHQGPGAHRRRQGLLRRRRHLRHAAPHECAGRRSRLQRLAPPAARAPHAGAAAHHAQAGDRGRQRRRLRPGCRHRAGLRLHHRQRMGQLHLVATSTAASSPTAAACTSCRAASACPRPRS